MKPKLFAENSTTWNTNGIGTLSDAISCKVTEERNGKYELEMIYPTTGKHFSDIMIRKIIYAQPCQDEKPQPFRIYRMSRPIRGKVTINAQHLSYDLTKYVTLPFSISASSGACTNTLNQLKSGSVTTCPFTFWTDVTTVASYTQKVPASIRQRLGGIEGSVLDQFGGEYEWDGYNVKLHKQRGAVTNYTLRYGKNIIDVEQEENIANTATGVVPFWQDAGGEEVVYGNPVFTSHQSDYSTPLVVPLDLSDQWDEAPTTSQLNTAANVYVNKTDFGIPKVSVKVSFVNLADTEEYKDILPMQSVKLCDTVKVQFTELGIDTTAKVVETVYDVLAGRYESIQVGTLKSTLAGVITDYEASMALAVSNTGERVFAQAGTQAQELVNTATAWLTSSGGYVIAVKNTDGSWKELLFMDTNDVDTARNVLRINENGIGFSSRGVGGPYTQAWTLDGRLVIGGTNVPSISAIDNNGNVLFQASANGVSIDKGTITLKDGNNNIVFQASSSGITVGKGSISGASVTLGGANNSDGILTLKNSNGYDASIMDNSGLHLYDGSANKTEIASLTGNGITMNKGSININDKFKVNTSGDITAPSGTIAGFTIEPQHIRHNNTDSTSSGSVTMSTSDFSRKINEKYRSDLRFAIGYGFGVDENGKVYVGEIEVGGSDSGRISVYDEWGNKISEISDKHIYFNDPNTSDYIELKTKDSAAIVFNNNSFIDGTGGVLDSGMHINSSAIMLNASKIGIVKSRNAKTYYTGYTGDAVTSVGSNTLNKVVTDLKQNNDGSLTWTQVDFSYLDSYSTHGVVNGLVVN